MDIFETGTVVLIETYENERKRLKTLAEKVSRESAQAYRHRIKNDGLDMRVTYNPEHGIASTRSVGIRDPLSLMEGSLERGLFGEARTYETTSEDLPATIPIDGTVGGFPAYPREGTDSGFAEVSIVVTRMDPVRVDNALFPPGGRPISPRRQRVPKARSGDQGWGSPRSEREGSGERSHAWPLPEEFQTQLHAR